MSPVTDADNRRIALQVAAMLPANYEDALDVLAIAASLVRMVYDARPAKPGSRVVKLVE